MGRDYANKLIASFGVLGAYNCIQIPSSESQARPLTPPELSTTADISPQAERGVPAPAHTHYNAFPVIVDLRPFCAVPGRR